MKPIDVFKTYFSSLFARRMKYAFFGVQENTIVFTNLNAEELGISTYKDDNCVHFVTFKKTEDYEFIAKFFNVQTYKYLEITLKTFLQFIKNCDIEKTTVQMEEYAIECVTETGEKEIVGRLISELEIADINAFLNDYNKHVESAHEMPIDTISAIAKASLTLIRVYDKPLEALEPVRACCIPLLDGMNIPSINEYGRKSKEAYVASVISWSDGSMRCMFKFDNPTITVRSLQPLAVWVPSVIKEYKTGKD